MRGAEAGLRRKLLLHHVQGEQRRIIYGFHGAKAAGTPDIIWPRMETPWHVKISQIPWKYDCECIALSTLNIEGRIHLSTSSLERLL